MERVGPLAHPESPGLVRPDVSNWPKIFPELPIERLITGVMQVDLAGIPARYRAGQA
jgi:hypothetical protein